MAGEPQHSSPLKKTSPKTKKTKWASSLTLGFGKKHTPPSPPLSSISSSSNTPSKTSTHTASPRALENDLLEAKALKKQLARTIEQDIAYFNEKTDSYYHQLIKSTGSEGALQKSAELVHNHFLSPESAPSQHILSEGRAKAIVRQALEIIMAIYTLKRNNYLKTLFDTHLAPYSDAHEELCKNFMRHFTHPPRDDEIAPLGRFTFCGMKQALPSSFLQLLEADPAFDELLMRIVECDAMVERWHAKTNRVMLSIPHELLSSIANRPYISLEKFVIEWLISIDPNFNIENQEAITRWALTIKEHLAKVMNKQELSIAESLARIELQILEALEPQKKQHLQAAAQQLGKPAPSTITQVRELEGQLAPYIQGVLQDAIKAVYSAHDDADESEIKTLHDYISTTNYSPVALEAFRALLVRLELLEGYTELKEHLRFTLDLIIPHVLPIFGELQETLKNACDSLQQEMTALRKDASPVRPEEDLFLSLDLVHTLDRQLDFVSALKSLRPPVSPTLPSSAPSSAQTLDQELDFISALKSLRPPVSPTLQLPAPSSSTFIPAVPMLDLSATQQQPSPPLSRLNAPRGGR